MNGLVLLQVIVGVALIGLVMMQNQGSGLGSGFGGGSVSYHSRKGLEKYVFGLTIGLLVVFVALSIIGIAA